MLTFGNTKTANKSIMRRNAQKQLFKGIIGLLCLFGISYFFNRSTKTYMTRLAFDNVEALAEGEDALPSFRCYGTGSVDCFGHKVEVKFSNYSLEEE